MQRSSMSLPVLQVGIPGGPELLVILFILLLFLGLPLLVLGVVAVLVLRSRGSNSDDASQPSEEHFQDRGDELESQVGSQRDQPEE